MPDPASPLITVPLPTIDGREQFFGDTVRSYEETANVELLVYENLPTCGAAWLKGIQEGTGDYFHMGADDVTMHPGWAEAATKVCDMGYLPAARILNTNGTLQSCGPWETELPNGTILHGDDFTRSPIFSRKQWQALEPLISPILAQLHYYSDNIFTWAGRKLGMQTVVCRGYEYTHHLAEPGRGAGMNWNERMQHDHALYLNYTRSVA
jgi:hypothetical protein